MHPDNDDLSWWISDTVKVKKEVGEDIVSTPETLLHPFHADNKGTTYGSNGVRNIADLGYTYPELTGREEYSADAKGDKHYIRKIRGKIHDLYAPHVELACPTADYIVNVIYER